MSACHRFETNCSRKPAARSRGWVRPLRAEQLEVRAMLDCSDSLCFVDVGHDVTAVDTQTTLREAVNTTFVTEIKFNIPGNPTIVLTQGPLTVTRGLIIDGTNLAGPMEPAGPNIMVLSGSGTRVWNMAVSTASDAGSAVLIMDMDILGNPMAPPGTSRGGGIELSNTTNLTLERVSIANSETSGSGGAIDVLNGTSLTVNHSTLSGNTAIGSGGAISNLGTLTVYNSTISGNQSQLGGGIFAGPVSVNSIQNSTIANNSADAAGGGIHFSGADLTLQNSIVGGNSAPVPPNGPDIFDPLPGNLAASYSLVENPNGHAVMNGVSYNIVGYSPLLNTLADNGGPTLTHLPQAGSLAINAGGGSRATDQRLFSGVSGTALDMGSVEVDGTPLPDGDFNFDSLINGVDVDLLAAAIASGLNDPAFDLNGDSILDGSDLDQWLMLAGTHQLGAGKSFLRGDANLDGIVDGLDFIAWNAHKFTADTAWTHGNFDADGNIDGQDFIIWNANKFQSSDAARLTLSLPPAASSDRFYDPIVSRQRLSEEKIDTGKNRRLDANSASNSRSKNSVVARFGDSQSRRAIPDILQAHRVDAAHQSLYFGGLRQVPRLTCPYE